jgi:methylmalonyl-CoA/ethylmalonyl-CoA epimerase
MNPSHLNFHHLGLAVRRPDEARKFLTASGYELGTPVIDAGHNARLQLCSHANQPAVEIIWPGDAPGPVEKLTQRHPGGITYHVCYETDDLRAVVAAWLAVGLNAICISPPKPAPLFGGRPVSFYNLIGIGLVEILESA